MKKCNKCKEEKELNFFSKSKKRADGLQSKCKICESENNKINRQKNPNSKYYQKNKQYYQDYGKKWKEDNLDKWRLWFNEWQRNYNKNKYDNDPIYKLRMCVGARIRLSLKKQNKTKLGRTITYLGCDYNDLKIHIEKQFTEGMNWENYGKWEIDHIIPLSKGGSFHYTNLQPLWWLDNRQKSNKL